MEILQSAWRGKLLSTRKDQSGKHMAMSGPKSLLFSPVTVLANSTYRVTLELMVSSGNGITYVNIYGNRQFDFPHVKFHCKPGGWSTYNIDVEVGSFPNTVPMVFRIWREPGGTGTLLVKRTEVNLLEDKNAKKSEPQLISQEKVSHTRPPEPTSAVGAKTNLISPMAPKAGPQPRRGGRREDEARAAGRRTSREARTRRGRERPDPVQMPTAPKVLPEVVGEDGIKVSVVLSAYNRREFFDRSLMTYVKQTLPKKEFELIVVDDKSTEDIKGLCKQYSEEHGIKFQYILLDRSKGAIPPATWTPALSNNVGFKAARGSVIVITGPETLQKEKNLEISFSEANAGTGVFAYTYRSNVYFVDQIKKDNLFKSKSFDEIINIGGAKDSAGVNVGWWWYYVALRKEHIMAIGGVDERYGLGISGEDDNFSLRLRAYGLPLKRNQNIQCIHQDHAREDKNDLHSFRFNKSQWNKFRKLNINLLSEWISNKDPVANKNIDWGANGAVVEKEIF